MVKKMTAGLTFSLVLSLYLCASYGVQALEYWEEKYELDCRNILIQVTKRVMADMVQCIMDMKKMPRGGAGTDCAIVCGMKKLKLMSPGSNRIGDKEVEAFITLVTKAQYVDVGKILMQDCLKVYNAIPEDKLDTTGKCEPQIELLKCMQEEIITSLAIC